MTKDDLCDLIDSWENLPLIVSEMEAHPDKLRLLMDVALHGKQPKSWRAVYVTDKINDNHPDLIAPFIPEIILQLKKEKNSSKKRQFLKLVSKHDIPEKYFSFLIDYCLNCFTSSNEPVAVRVFAMQILYNISDKKPDLKPELLLVTEYEMELHPTPGVLAKGRNIAKKLNSQINKL